jgi:hypothetical protein
VLTATVDKPLRRKDEAAGVKDGVGILRPRRGVAEVQAKVELLDDRNFRTRFDNVRTPLDFVFEFTDTDGVVGLRHVVVKPQPDAPPEVDAQVEVIRKTNQGYLITPFALVPFSGKVRDDHGLDEVNYVCTLTRLENQGEAGGKTILLLSTLAGLGGGLGQDLVTAVQVAALAKQSKSESAAEEPEPERQPVPAFVEALQQRAGREVLPQQDLLRFLPLTGDKEYEVADPGQPSAKKKLLHPVMTRSLLNEFGLEPDRPASDFDLLKLMRGPKIASEREIQPRYRMQIWLEAVDNDILTGPHRSQGKEKFTFQVVSVNELLSEIAKEEENLHLKLDDMAGRLKEGRSKLDQVIADLGTTSPKAEQFAPMTVRAEEIEQVREKAETATGEVLTDYQRILREMDYNRVQRVQHDIIERIQRTIANPLDEVLHGDFPRVREGLDEFHRVLDNKDLDVAARAEQSRKAGVEARDRLETLIKHLDQVLNSMEQLTNINTLIKQLQRLEEAERAQYDVLDRLKKEIEESILKDLFGEDSPKDKKK